MEPFTVGRFDRGMTDDYIDGHPSAARKVHNLRITKQKKLKQRPGIAIFNSSAPQIPAGNQQIDSAYYFDSTLFVKSGTKLYYLQDGDTAWSTLGGPSSHDAFPDSELGAKCSWSEWKGHLFITPGPSSTKKGGCNTQKVYRNSSNVWTLRQAGLPSANDNPWGGAIYAPPSTTVGGPNYSYIWYVVFYITYTAKVNGQDVTFKFYGGDPLILQEQANSTTPDFTSLGGLAFTNGSTQNYDTANMQAAVFRTEADDVVPYFVKYVNLSTTISDTGKADEDLGEPMYAGAQDGNFNDPFPASYFTRVLDNSTWCFGCIDTASGALHATRVLQGKPGIIEGLPSGNYVDVEGGTVGTAFGLAGKNPMAFLRDKCFRIEGRFDALGGGGLRAVKVSNVYGAVSQDVLETGNGIFFPSEKGWCYTDGFTAKLVSEHLIATYKALLNKSKMTGAYDSKNDACVFGVESTLGSGSGYNNYGFVLDVAQMAEVGTGVFLTMDAQSAWQPTAMCYDSANDRVIVGDKRGYVFKLDETVYYDVNVNTGVAYASWYRDSIIYDYISTTWSFGSSLVSKWMGRFHVVAKNISGALSLDLFQWKDDKTTALQLKVVRERKATSTGLFKIFRWAKKGALWSIYSALQIKKGYVVIARSDDYALATLNGTTNQATLASGSWPNDGSVDLRGHYLHVASDAYATAYQITAQSGATVTVTDSGNTFPTASGVKWEVRGYPKEEPFELHSIGAEPESLASNPTAFEDGGEGGNA